MIYTDYEAIRGSLGVDEEDCPDALIADSKLTVELEIDLDTWLPTHAAIFSAGSAELATADEVRRRQVLELYAQWFCAYELAGRFLLYPQIVSDGKAQMNRFANFDLDAAQERAGMRMARYKAWLNEEVNGASSAISGALIMSVSTPSYDPVTNT